MQAIRTVLYYLSPLGGAVLGGVIGLSYHPFIWAIEVLIGFVAGCVLSVLMIILSIRARFKSDVSLTQNTLINPKIRNPE
jgi:hypothetical protein